MTSSFSIQAVAERTGLSPHVIRAWERRYQAIKPERTAGKHRLYSQSEIERLSLLHRAVRNGHSIGKIARLSIDNLLTLAPSRPSLPRLTENDPATVFRGDALVATKRFDAPALEAALKRALLALGHQGLIRLTVAPLAEEIGECWRSGELTAAHEHFFTATVKVFLGDLTQHLAMPHNAPRIVVGTPTGQLHELGAVMAAATAANLGWRPVYLGPSLPAHEIAGAALRNQAAAVALSIVYPEDDPNLPHELTELARLLPEKTPILAGGRAARSYFETLVHIGALYADSIEEFETQLDGLRRPTARKNRS